MISFSVCPEEITSSAKDKEITNGAKRCKERGGVEKARGMSLRRKKCGLT